MEMRYLFRGKRLDNGDWVQGYLIYAKKDCYVCENPYECMSEYSSLNGQSYGFGGFKLVDPSTICQCTGMPDKNSKVAYEHDIIETPVGNAKIIWSCSPSPTDNHINVGFEIVFLDATANDNYRHDLGYWIGKSEVIGNIFDEGSENIGKGAEEN